MFSLFLRKEEYYRNLIFFLLFSAFFRRDSEYLLKKSDTLFGSECKREFQISQGDDNNSFLVRWNERVVIMHSYAEFVEVKRANVRNFAFVRQVIEIKRTSVNYSFCESFACTQMRMRNFVYA